MHGIDFIQDLAIVMIVAGLTTILCHRLRQPVVLGYSVALGAFIIGAIMAEARESGKIAILIEPDEAFLASDRVLLLGGREPLAHAREYLERGRVPS